MAELVITGGKTKRVNSRFGGETAWKQHAGDDRETLCNDRRRADKRFTASLLQDLDADIAEACADTCACTGQPKPVNGVVCDGSISLVYSEGRIVAAHCG